AGLDMNVAARRAFANFDATAAGRRAIAGLDMNVAARRAFANFDATAAGRRALAGLDMNVAARRAFANFDVNAAGRRALVGLATGSIDRAERLFGLPPNLSQLGGDLDVERVVVVGRTIGVSLYLVPRTSVCRLLLSAPDDDVLSVLVDHEDEVLTDCEALLDRCTRSELGTFVGLARDAVHAHGDGHVRAAQSLAATTLDSLLSTVHGATFARDRLSHRRGDEPDTELTTSPLAYQLVHLPLWCAHEGSVAKIVKLEHAWRRLDGRNDDGFQVAPFPG
ncbi:hypothetical protein, partial [Isoptericola rhizosphaerae]|uniref:hypothetical protein n=1 Tax=Isoptericola rhizosphaerae TaxID=3377837 RepID=UPI00383B0A21